MVIISSGTRCLANACIVLTELHVADCVRALGAMQVLAATQRELEKARAENAELAKKQRFARAPHSREWAGLTAALLPYIPRCVPVRCWAVQQRFLEESSRKIAALSRFVARSLWQLCQRGTRTFVRTPGHICACGEK